MTESNPDSTPTNELIVTRVFDAPRELVYQAFVDADQLPQWFGPVGFSVPRDTVDIDARVGGHQRFTMVQDGNPEVTAPVDATFTEMIENELLVGVESSTDGPPVSLRIEFHDEGGKTRLVVRQEPFDEKLVGLFDQGWESSFTKLDTLLAA